MASSCVTIKDTTVCSTAGIISAGGICAHTNSDQTGDLSFDEFLDFIEAQPERECVPVRGMNICDDDQSQGQKVKLPARGAAIVMSSDDWNTMKTELEVACRELGSMCGYEMKKIIANGHRK